MTRKEERIEAAKQRYGEDTQYLIAKTQAFLVGAKWADETMIDKACEYLYKWNQEQTKKFGAKATIGCSEYTLNVADFRKTMKGE